MRADDTASSNLAERCHMVWRVEFNRWLDGVCEDSKAEALISASLFMYRLDYGDEPDF